MHEHDVRVILDCCPYRKEQWHRSFLQTQHPVAVLSYLMHSVISCIAAVVEACAAFHDGAAEQLAGGSRSVCYQTQKKLQLLKIHSLRSRSCPYPSKPFLKPGIIMSVPFTLSDKVETLLNESLKSADKARRLALNPKRPPKP